MPEGHALYDLERDPHEQRNLLAGELGDPERSAFRRLQAELRAAVPTSPGPPQRTNLDDATRERLEALGYLEPTP